MRVCKHGCFRLGRIFENNFIQAIESFSVFTLSHLNTRTVARILESYANRRLRLGFA